MSKRILHFKRLKIDENWSTSKTNVLTNLSINDLMNRVVYIVLLSYKMFIIIRYDIAYLFIEYFNYRLH